MKWKILFMIFSLLLLGCTINQSQEVPAIELCHEQKIGHYSKVQICDLLVEINGEYRIYTSPDEFQVKIEHCITTNCLLIDETYFNDNYQGLKISLQNDKLLSYKPGPKKHWDIQPS